MPSDQIKQNFLVTFVNIRVACWAKSKILLGVAEPDHAGDHAGQQRRDDGVLEVHPNEAVITSPGERVRYETPDGARYVAICMPAFSPDTVHRDA